ncbi:PAS domain-containing protein [Bdellovibrio sp.]|uniref:PAS domain-containing protein n=1 Tax=Bdellovibrio sp. TaxID=28201 RepID=UPI0039E71C16
MSVSELESAFDLKELFFSKTDLKGIIQSGNAVFIRVSEFSEEELLKKPHNIIRHGDMPRSVFKLFWNFLKEGKPIAAYVKNKSKKGRYYWVFAMAFPMQDGYLSVRLKPTSSLFLKVQELYKEVLALEAEGASLEDGIEFINRTLQSLGFSSYEEFMKKALVEELVSRDTLLMESGKSVVNTKKSVKGSIDNFLAISDSCTSAARQSFAKTRLLFDKLKDLVKESQAIVKTCRDVKYVTVNLTISSAKLGDSGRPLSVVSNNLEKLTGEIAQSSSQFEEIFKSYEKSVFDMYFSIATSRFQIEMMKHLTDEVLEESQNSGEFTNAQEQFLFFNCSLLRKLISENFSKVTATSAELVRTNKSLLISVEALSKVTAGMGVIHVVGKIEMARTGSSSDSLASRLKEMEELTEVFKKTLKNLEQECSMGLAICNELNGHNQIITNDLKRIDQLIAV